MTKKKRILIVVIAVVLVVCWRLALMISPYSYGLNRINARFGKVYLRCTEFHGYEVEKVDSDALSYRGERQMPINDDLGDYVVKVSFGDEDLSGRLKMRYFAWTTYRIGLSRFRFMYSRVGDHGFDLFIGSDTPIEEDDIVVIGFDLDMIKE